MAEASTTPKKSHLNLDSLSIKSPSYTSLKDVLPFSAAVNSPTASAAGGHHILIRNRLVKQAAWAYLQPMSTSPSGPSGPHFFHRIRHRFSSSSSSSSSSRRNPLACCLSFLCHHLVPCFTRILHQILHAIRGQVPILFFLV
ncbi:hypothetical protein VNO77_15862 [Canavalia gladiata]|uniref:Uncharacterized protein n=1 Tax=Canavalia gladiata TaxID=3824 RepID=A0AAN9M342_CANGL